MSTTSRRNFLAAGALAPAAFITPRPVRAAEHGVHADVIVTGGRVLTMDPSMPTAEAIALRGNRILAVGSASDIANLKGWNTKIVDATGHTVTPGFIDAHSHPVVAREAVSVNVALPSIRAVKEALREEAERTPPGQWVQGFMYDDTKFDENRPLTRADIDEVVTDHPVLVRHRGGHTGVVNSKGFEVAGVTIDTPDPVGGKYYRENGEFQGKVAETAMFALEDHGTWPVIDREVYKQAAIVGSANMAAAGLTSTTDAWGSRDNFVALQDARAANALSFRISFMPYSGDPIYQGLVDAGVHSGFGDDMIRIGAVKFVADGSASERTMRMSTPFKGRPDDYGITIMTQEELYEAVESAVANDFRVAIHANGDVTIDQALKAYERVLPQFTDGQNPRFRLEHCSLVNEDLLKRIKATGSIPAPFYTYAHYHGNKWVEYGEEKMQNMFAHRSFLDHGIPVAPASDYTPGPYEPMMAIQSMVTRKDMQGRVWGPSQRISIDEALMICTMHGAYASFEETIKGSLTAGKLADYVILENDPHDVDPDDIKNIRVLKTVLGGKTTFEA